jgi:hypothetical protein
VLQLVPFLLVRIVVHSKATLERRTVMLAHALSSLASVWESWSMRVLLLVPVRLETALQSDLVTVARLASASKCCCCRSSWNVSLAEWKPALWEVIWDSLNSWLARAKSLLKLGYILLTRGLRRQLWQGSVNSPV